MEEYLSKVIEADSQYFQRYSTTRSNRHAEPCKRKFHGNRLTSGSDDAECSTSSSEKKLFTASTEDIIVHTAHCYQIIEFLTVFFAIYEIVICRYC